MATLHCPPITSAVLHAYDPVRLRAYDHWHIDLSEPWEVRFWTREFDCDEQALRCSVDAVGSIAADVRIYLATRGGPAG